MRIVEIEFRKIEDQIDINLIIENLNENILKSPIDSYKNFISKIRAMDFEIGKIFQFLHLEINKKIWNVSLEDYLKPLALGPLSSRPKKYIKLLENNKGFVRRVYLESAGINLENCKVIRANIL